MAYYGDNAVHAWGCAGSDGDLSDGFNNLLDHSGV